MARDSRRFIEADSDQEILDALSAELNRRMSPYLTEESEGEDYAAALAHLPAGLRSMAAIHQLDVSITLDDLGWHFGNWHHHGYAAETSRGLRHLGADRAADIFDAAHHLASQWWKELERDDDFAEWYHGSELELALRDLNSEIWSVRQGYGDLGFLQLWVNYAREHPNVIDEH
jgi:hypothetical protein